MRLTPQLAKSQRSKYRFHSYMVDAEGGAIHKPKECKSDYHM